MLMRVIAHGMGVGGTDAVRGSALKCSCCARELNLHQRHAGLTFYQLSWIPLFYYHH